MAIESAKEFLSFLRSESYEWMKQDIPSLTSVEARIVEVSDDGVKARIQRSGMEPDKQFYPCLGPYSPVVGDYVLCARHGSGLIIQGNIPRNGGVTTSQFARQDSPEFTGKPLAPNPESLDDYSNQVATTMFIEDKLKSSPILGGDPKAPTPIDDDDGEAIANTSWVRGLLSRGPNITSPLLNGNVAASSDTSVDLSLATKVAVPAPQDFDDAVPKGFLEANYVDRATTETDFPRKDALNGGFTAPVSGVDPTSSTHLVTKAFADNTYVSPSSLSSYAPLASPSFSGTPQAPTDASNTNSTRIPTQSWVNTFFATKASPTFTGTVTVPTPTNDNSQQAATTAWVMSKQALLLSGNPAFTGIPTAQPDISNTNSNRIPTQSWVNQFFLSKSGDVMTGPLTLSQDPTSSMHAATRQWVLGMTGGFKVQKGTAFGFTGQGENVTIVFSPPFTTVPTLMLTMANRFLPTYNNVSLARLPIPFSGAISNSSADIGVFTKDGSSANFAIDWVAYGV